MSLGPLMIDIDGLELTAEDREVLRHPLVGGLILFSRNFDSAGQLSALLKEVHALREPRLLVAVDHEGGRVQRFRKDFTVLPAARKYGQDFDADARRGLAATELGGWLMASECLAVGIDISFAPILDLDYGVSSIIGDRAFHKSVDGVARLAGAFMHGMKRAGMAATGKHFPGHGGVAPDSHLELPEDPRRLADLRQRDMVPFQRLIRNNLAAIMMAHVVYPDVDPLPASFSTHWIGNELRKGMDFRGAVFCDDLSMEGAAGIGGYAERASVALAAGCDMLPVCNSRQGVVEILDALEPPEEPALHIRLARLHGRASFTLGELQDRPEWRAALDELRRIDTGDTQQLQLDS